MKKQMPKGTSWSDSLYLYMVGVALVALLSVYQGYSGSLTSSIISNSWQWLASILFSWGILLIFFTSSRKLIRAAWALVIIIMALGLGRFMSTQSTQTSYDKPDVSMAFTPIDTVGGDSTQKELPQMVDLNQSYQQAILEAGWYSILDVSRLQNDPQLIESYAIIEDTRQAIQSHLLQTQQQAFNLEHEVYDSEASAILGDDYVEDLIHQSQVQKRMWKSELAALNEVKKIIVMLDERQNEWSIQDGELVFHSEVDRKQFEEILTNLQQIASGQQQLEQ